MTTKRHVLRMPGIFQGKNGAHSAILDYNVSVSHTTGNTEDRCIYGSSWTHGSAFFAPGTAEAASHVSL